VKKKSVKNNSDEDLRPEAGGGARKTQVRFKNLGDKIGRRRQQWSICSMRRITALHGSMRRRRPSGAYFTNTPPGIIYMLDNICNNRSKKAIFSLTALFCLCFSLTVQQD